MLVPVALFISICLGCSMKILNLIEVSCQNTICRVKLHFFPSQFSKRHGSFRLVEWGFVANDVKTDGCARGVRNLEWAPFQSMILLSFWRSFWVDDIGTLTLLWARCRRCTSKIVWIKNVISVNEQASSEETPLLLNKNYSLNTRFLAIVYFVRFRSKKIINSVLD